MRLSQSSAAIIMKLWLTGFKIVQSPAWAIAVNAARPPGTRIRKMVAELGSSSQREPRATK